MKPLGKLARLAAALVPGLVLILSGYPTHSQEFSSQDCFEAVDYYEDYADLDYYSEEEVYCLFVVELLGYGYIDPDQEYDNAYLKQLILDALGDSGDFQDGDTYDNDLTYAEIEEEFPGDELSNLVDTAIYSADQQSRVFQSSPSHLTADRVVLDNVPVASALKQNGKTRGGTAVHNVASAATQYPRRHPY